MFWIKIFPRKIVREKGSILFFPNCGRNAENGQGRDVTPVYTIHLVRPYYWKNCRLFKMLVVIPTLANRNNVNHSRTSPHLYLSIIHLWNLLPIRTTCRYIFLCFLVSVTNFIHNFLKLSLALSVLVGCKFKILVTRKRRVGVRV